MYEFEKMKKNINQNFSVTTLRKLIKNPRFLLALILVFGLFLRLYFFVGLNWSDDVGYVADAYSIFKGNFNYPGYTNALRWMVLHPIALFFSIFGINNFSAALYPLICSLLTILLGFYFGKLVSNVKIGVITAFLISFFPLNVIYATWIMPDVPIAFFIGLSVYLFLKGEKERKILFYFLSGCSIGIAYLHKISGILPFLFIVPYILYKILKERKINFNYSLIFVGFLLIFTLEGFFYLSNTGDFLLRYHVVKGHFTEPGAIEKHALNPSLTYYPQGLLNLTPNFRFNWNNKYFVQYGLFYYFIILSGVYLIIKKFRKSYPIILWVLIFFLYLEFGSMSLTHYTPIHKLYRHLTVLTLPSLLILSYFLFSLLNKKSGKIKKGISISIIVFLFITSVYYTYYRHFYLKESVRDQKKIYKFLQNKPEKLIYGDGGTIGHLRFYSKFKWDKRLKGLGSWTECEDLNNSYIITYGTRGWVESHPFYKDLPDCVRNPPENWKLIKTIEGSDLYVYGRYDPKIYFVPQSNQL